MTQMSAVCKEDVTAVVLVGNRDFGRCPLATQLPTPLWPVAGKSVLERLLEHLTEEGICQVVICCCGDAQMLADSLPEEQRSRVTFLDHKLAVGTAGSVREAAAVRAASTYLCVSGSIVNPPRIDPLLESHAHSGCRLSVVFNPDKADQRQLGASVGIYICSEETLDRIPQGGYYDIKESLIPAMLRAGHATHPIVLSERVGNFRDGPGYLRAVGECIEQIAARDPELVPLDRSDNATLWGRGDVKIDPSARIFGSVVCLGDAELGPSAVVFGPAVVGSQTRVGAGAVVSESVLWDRVTVADGARIERCVIGHHARIGERDRVGAASVSCAKAHPGRLQAKPTRWPITWLFADRRRLHVLGAVLLAVVLFWSYRSTLTDLWSVWQRSDEYSSGLLVPFLAAYVLWGRRERLRRCVIRPCLWGLALLVGAQAMRFFGLLFYFGSLENLSFVLTVGSLVLLVLGRRWFAKTATVLLFLCLMLPWPNRVQGAITLPLQSWATSSAVFCLELVGYYVVREGNVIQIGQASVAVAEACNGLRMITAFFVIGSLVVLLVDRAWWEKLIIILSSLPIALLCNTLRLAITAVFFTILQGEYWEKVFHDFGGYAMMPLALAIIVAELWLLTKLTTAPQQHEPIIVTRR